MRLRDYRAHLGVVLQDNFLFDGTIGENIKYARPHATLDEVRAVSRIAHCDEFIEAFEKQYDTIVGERGVRLSGGQRQRVAIARAILANPRILILDEATSSLDSESEALIQDGLHSLRQGRTTFVIAHRLSTISGAAGIVILVSRRRARSVASADRHEDPGGEGGSLPPALRQAVPLRARSLHQSGRRLHARARSRAQRASRLSITLTSRCVCASRSEWAPFSTAATVYEPPGRPRNSNRVVRGACSPSS